MSDRVPEGVPGAKTNVGIFIFDGVEVLDFAGPYEVFSRTRTVPGLASRLDDSSAPFKVFTMAAQEKLVTATGGLRVMPDHSFDNSPHLDLLVVPGGFGTRVLLQDQGTLDWLQAVHRSAAMVTSVCTGSLLLARAGLLAGRRATTHWGAVDRLQELDPSILVQRQERVVDDGIVTSAGVAAGMDMSLAMVAKLCGTEVAAETARYLELPAPA